MIKLLCRALLFSLSCGAACAAPMTYQVNVNTSSLNGTTGSLDFNFEPGPLTTQSASVSILGFTTDGSLGSSASTTGNVSGDLAANTLQLNNGSGFNDYFNAITFANTVTFTVSLFGPALSAPNGTATSGSLFAFSVFSDAGGTTPALTTDTVNGFGYTVAVNLNGSTTATNYLTAGMPPAVTPEPSSLLLCMTGALAALCFIRKRLSDVEA